MAMVDARQFSVWGVNLNPTSGSEQSGFRPVVIISPDSMNDNLNTVIVAPMTTLLRKWPTRISIKHGNKSGEAALEQIWPIDQCRLNENMGKLDKKYHAPILDMLREVFSY